MNLYLFCCLLCIGSIHGILRPQDSETREIKSLNGIWKFRKGESLNPKQGFEKEWYKEVWSYNESLPMPVPSSYNDITQDKSLRDHVGWVWYQRKFFTLWAKETSWRRIFIRFDSAHYATKVWINGIPVLKHKGGHLPFEADITNVIKVENIVTVAVNNTLTPITLPQGTWNRYEGQGKPQDYFTLDYKFDFFNYAGIHRNVFIYSIPKQNTIKNIQIYDIKVNTDLSEARIYLNIERDSNNDNKCMLELYQENGEFVTSASCSDNPLIVSQPKLWWPYLKSPANESPGYLYILKVSTSDDIYRLKVGIREILFSKSKGLLINKAPFYFRGFGKHEDSDIRGKGLDLPTIVKDFNLIKWIGANSFRTSHYPYAEEILDMADELGIVVICESPGVSLDEFSKPLLKNHIQVMKEMIDRDKNRASVIIWSIANEPRSFKKSAKEYFSSVVNATRRFDSSRPVMAVLNASPNDDYSAEFLDLVGINKYAGWYSDTGHTEVIEEQIYKLINSWWERRKIPIVMTEYGADTLSGFHQDPSFLFTEEYQVDTMRQYFRTFDRIRKDGNVTFIGEMIWNFADFMTKQTITRPVGNKKGIFTRQRQPKMSAHFLKSRYWGLSSGGKNSSLTSNCWDNWWVNN
ncbi:beta-glucuronidase [Lepeophtheirus salmonis]|uniref:beta-glucuronidase n=1 Tax=Lepeophtheirus salmonis TaxID=72036 RepID=UPI001AE44333|nr:beta-glucuronidase-like [Lepeophtheirus salmonis]